MDSLLTVCHLLRLASFAKVLRYSLSLACQRWQAASSHSYRQIRAEEAILRMDETCFSLMHKLAQIAGQ